MSQQSQLKPLVECAADFDRASVSRAVELRDDYWAPRAIGELVGEVVFGYASFGFDPIVMVGRVDRSGHRGSRRLFVACVLDADLRAWGVPSVTVTAALTSALAAAKNTMSADLLREAIARAEEQGANDAFDRIGSAA